MKRKRRYGSIITMMVLSVMCSTGCKTKEAGQKKEKVRLEFFNRKREVYQVLEEIIQLFNESQDEIEVYQNMTSNVDAALRIAAVEGKFPDIVELGGLQSVETFEYVMGGCLIPLDDMACVKNIKENITGP